MTQPLPNSFKESYKNSATQPFSEIHITSNQNIKFNEDLFSTPKNNYRIFIHKNFNTTFEKLKQKLMAQFFKLGYLDIQVEHLNLWLAVHHKNENSYISLLSTDNGEFIIEGIETEIINFLDELL